MAIQLKRDLRRLGAFRLALWAGAIASIGLLSGLIVLPGSTRGATTPTATFTPAEDTFVKSTSPDGNYGLRSTLQADNYPSVKLSLIRFNVTGIPAGSTVTSAALRMFVVDPSSQAGEVFTVTADWSEGTTTWRNAPSVGNKIGDLSGPAVNGTWREANVTSAVTGSGYVDFYILTASTNGVYYSSSESGSNPPALVVQWSASFSTPTALATPTPTDTPISPSPTPTPTPASTPTTTPTPTTAPTSTPVVSPPGVPGGSTPVFAYYYLWWGDHHWQSKLGPNYPYDSPSPLPLPATLDAGGCNPVSLYAGNQITDVPAALFSQDDPGRILEDVRTAATYGLSGFIANWNGNGLANQTVTSTSNHNNQRLDALVKAVNQVNSEGIPFKLWISYKASSVILPLAAIQGDLAYFTRMYGGSPAFDRRGGKPVFIWTGSRKYALATIQAVSTQFRGSLFLMGDENWNSWGDGRAAYFDGDSYYWSTQNPYTNPSSFSQLQNLAKMVRASANPDGSQKLWFAPLAAGYNSILLGGSTCVPRNGGETLRRLFDGNSQTKPDGWAFISWNEVAEGTHVEPLQRWGNLYLGYLKALVSK